MNSFYSSEELKEIGFRSFGNNVLISKKASIYSPSNISLGSNVRIDDFCILSGKIEVNDYVHIAAYSALYGGEDGIFIEAFSNISSKVSIYSISDDYSGESMTNPLVPNKYKNILSKKVVIRKHSIIGSGCVILPGVTLHEGSSFGALSLINRDSEEWSINVGIPFREIKKRSRNALRLEKQFMEERTHHEI